MGSAGWSISLKPAAGKGTATLTRVRGAVLDRLYHAWNKWLPGRYSSVAWRWVSLGEDSLLTIGDRDLDRTVPGQIMFWFYDSVRWPQGLAEHWLKLALAMDRRNLEHSLAKLKHAIDDADGSYPTLSSELLDDGRGGGRRFFQHAGKIGVASRGEIAWELGEEGDDYELPSTPFEELNAEGRARVLRVLEGGVCGCPFCEHLRAQGGLDPGEPAAGWAATPVEAWHTDSITHFEPFEDGSSLVATSEYRRASWVLRAAKRGAPWLTDETLSHDKRKLQFLTRSGDTLVAWTAFANARAAQPPLRVSSDRGATWTTEEPVGIPANTLERFHAVPHRPGTVFATLDKERALYRSDDGGRSWVLVTKELGCGEEPPRLCSHLTSARDDASRLFAVFHYKKAVKPAGAVAFRQEVIARSDDGGVTFRALPWPGTFSAKQLVMGKGGVVAVFGSSPKGACMVRSTDGGESFGVAKEMSGTWHLYAVASSTGRWFWGVSRASPGLLTSSDDGETWEPCARPAASRIFLDPSAPDAAWFATKMALMRIEAAGKGESRGR